MCRKRLNDLTICSWNVRSLTEISGDIRISRRNGPPSNSTVDRKLDLLVGELKRYRVSVAGVQETKWFGYCWYALCQDRTQWTKLCNAQVCKVAQSRRQNTCAANSFPPFPQDNTYNCSVVDSSTVRGI